MSRLTLLLLVICIIPAQGVQAVSQTWLFNTWIGTDLGAVDDYDSMDEALTQHTGLNFATYHAPGLEGWTGPESFYRKDIRAPLDDYIGAVKQWRLYMWSKADLPPDAALLQLTWHLHVSPAPLTNVALTLTYVRPALGIAPDWHLAGYQTPTAGDAISLNTRTEGNWVFPVYPTTDPFEGYIFDLTATVVPEPSSLSILSLALASAGAWRLRRRR